jgi:hypothetical protein
MRTEIVYEADNLAAMVKGIRRKFTQKSADQALTQEGLVPNNEFSPMCQTLE